MKLSATDGYCYAYYPYSPSASSITSIPVTAGETDYLYATPVTVNDKDHDATLQMKHALAAIRFALKKGTYAGTGAVTAVSVASSALGSSGTLNATTGNVTAENLGTAVSQPAGFNLSTTEQNVDVVMVPSGNEGTITLSVTIDGKIYSTEISSTTIRQGSCYTCTLTVDAGNLALSGIEIDDWGYDDLGAPVITAGGYKITFAGDYEDIAFINSVSGNNVTIETIQKLGYYVNAVTSTGTAVLSQSVAGMVRIITLSEVESDITLTFNGYYTPLQWPEDGIYVVQVDGNPVDPVYANPSNIGVALSNSATNQRLMIEKYENANNAESATIYAKAAQVLGSTYTYFFSWGGYGTDQSGITTYPYVDGSNSKGYLPKSDGTYENTPNLSGIPSAWASGALSDFEGKSNCEVIINITSSGNSLYKTAPMSYLINAFNAEDCPSSVNQGYRDWFVPSCGQLGLIYLNLAAINNALTAIGGTPFSAGNYWPSSELSKNRGWCIDLSNGDIGHDWKYGEHRLRLVRDL